MCGCVKGDRMVVRDRQTNTTQYGTILDVQTKRFTGVYTQQEFEIQFDNGEIIDVTANYNLNEQFPSDVIQLSKVSQEALV